MKDIKKIILYSLIVLLLIVVTVGATYAYFTATTGGNIPTIDSGDIKISYSNGDEISGELNLSTDKSGGFNTTVSISKMSDSIPVKSNLYILINEMSEDLAQDGLRWEIYKTYQGTTTKENEGSFEGYSDGDRIYLLEEYYELTTTTTQFTIYLWLDGTKVENEVVGTSLDAVIKAESNVITGDLS